MDIQKSSYRALMGIVFLLLCLFCSYCISGTISKMQNDIHADFPFGQDKRNIENYDSQNIISHEQLGNKTEYSGRVNGTNSSMDAVSDLHYRGFLWEFSVVYKYQACCPGPVMQLYSDVSHTSSCFSDEQVDSSFSSNSLTVYLNPNTDNNRFVNCSMDEFMNSVTCTGSRNLLISLEKTWNVSFGYKCQEIKELDLLYNMNFTRMFESEPVSITQEMCMNSVKYDYIHYVVPNLLGMSNHGDIYYYVITYKNHIHLYEQCYQHAIETFCRFLFPNVVNGIIHYPCVKMCQDFLQACNLAMQKICAHLMDSKNPDVCFYRTVVCEPPYIVHSIPTTSNGSHPGDKLNITCENGYKIVDASTTECMYSGNWVPNVYCVPVDRSNNLTLIIGLSVSFSLIVVVTMVAVCIFISYSRRELTVREENLARRVVQGNERFDVYVCYGTEDREYVLKGDNCLRKILEVQGYLLCIHERDFPPGDCIFGNIMGAMEQSKAVLFLVSREFVQREWCMYEFKYGLNHKRVNPDFKVIVALLQDDNNFQDLPAENILMQYMNTHTYLKTCDADFYEKLVYTLCEPTCAAMSGVTPGNINFVQAVF